MQSYIGRSIIRSISSSSKRLCGPHVARALTSANAFESDQVLRKADFRAAHCNGWSNPRSSVCQAMPMFSIRHMTTSVESDASDSPQPISEVLPRIKFKSLAKTARNIMQILDKEAVEEVKSQRELPDIQPGYIIQLKVEVPENKRRISTLKGIVIARRNAGFATTIRLRRSVAGVGIESLFPLYSPNIKEIKVLDKKKVRRANKQAIGAESLCKWK
ncbi:hypothetical protein ACFE04_009512 [Oxalis oulophora]